MWQNINKLFQTLNRLIWNLGGENDCLTISRSHSEIFKKAKLFFRGLVFGNIMAARATQINQYRVLSVRLKSDQVRKLVR